MKYVSTLSDLPKCPTSTHLTRPVGHFFVLHPLEMKVCPTRTRDRTYSRLGVCGTLWRLGAEEAGAVGLEELAEVVDAGHDALAFVGVAD